MFKMIPTRSIFCEKSKAAIPLVFSVKNLKSRVVRLSFSKEKLPTIG